MDTRLEMMMPDERMAKLEAMLAIIDRRDIGFSDVVAISGVDARQFRSGLDRGVMNIGEKLNSVGRWVFSLRDCFQAIIVADLSRRTWTPVAQCARIGELVAPHVERFLRDTFAAGTEPENLVDIQVAAFADGGDVRVIEGRRGIAGGGTYELDGTRIGSWDTLDEAHVRIRFLGLMMRLIEGVKAIEA